MDKSYARFSENSTSIYTDPSMRQENRPPNKGFEAWGSDFNSASKRETEGGTKHAAVYEAVSSPSESSEDELNIISAPRPSQAGKRRAAAAYSDSLARSVQVDGDVYAYTEPPPKIDSYAEELAKKSLAMKGMKFKKKGDPDTKACATGALAKRAPSPPAQEESTRRVTRTKQSSRAEHGSALKKPFKVPSRIGGGENNLHQRSPPHDDIKPSCSTSVHAARGAYAATAESRPARRPAPRTANRTDAGTSKTQGSEGPETRRRKPAEFPMAELSPLKETNNTTQNGKREVQQFPMSDYSPLKSIDLSAGETVGKTSRSSFLKGEGTSRTREAGRPTAPPSPHSNPFASRTTDVTRSSVQSFPVPSPLSSPAQSHPPSHQQPKQPVAETDFLRKKSTITGKRQDEAHIRLQREAKLKPFPMDSRELWGIRHSPLKRGSSEGIPSDSDEDDEARETKRARGGEEILRELMRSEDMIDSDDEMIMDSQGDPSALCPWCDEPLPTAPSPHLEKLIAVARSQSYRDPRITNPLGLHASPTVFLNVCHRHRFERHQIPLARQRGWPTHIEWDKLAQRVAAMKAKLQRIVHDIDEDFDPGNERHADNDIDNAREDHMDAKDSLSLSPHRPRKASVFWKEVVRSVKQRGSSKMSGVQAQLSSFSKTQPGYYGELGSMILSQTLYDLFPPIDFPASSTLPLTPADFVQRVLLPEAAVCLIMQDMNQDRQDAIATMRESAQYGVAMFPDDQGEAISAGEKIVKQRAAVRRKQLEDEEDDDHVHEPPTSSMTSSKPSSKASTTLSEPDLAVRPRHNTRRTATRQDYVESDGSNDARDSNSEGSDGGKIKKRRANQRAKPASQRTARRVKEVELSSAPPSSQPEASGQPRPKPRPRMLEKPTSDASETRKGKAEYIEIDGSDHDEDPPLRLAAGQRRVAPGRGRKEIPKSTEDGESTPKPKARSAQKGSSRASSVAAPPGPRRQRVSPAVYAEDPKTASSDDSSQDFDLSGDEWSRTLAL